MKSNVYLMLEKFFDESIIEIAKRLNYDEDNILILESNEEMLKQKYPETYNNLMSCNHNKDFRTPIQYAQDLVCSWIFEDYLLSNLKLCGLEIKLSGEDRNRKLLSSAKVSSNSDYLITCNNKNAFLELANDYKGYWKRNLICDLRDEKYNHIKNAGKESDYSLLLGIDFVSNEFFIIDLEKDKNSIKYSSHHWAYHKPVYSIELNNIKYEKFTFENICKKICEIMECR